MSKVIQASVKETAFNCPFCHVLTTQHWYRLFADPVRDQSRLPTIVTEESAIRILSNPELSQAKKEELRKFCNRLSSGNVLLRDDEREGGSRAYNIHLSQCYECKRFAVWVHDGIVFPSSQAGAEPNADLPDDILRDFTEAKGIVNVSPRGAAALLRLCIQKLCKHLGESGKNIDDDIASLVKKGLNPTIQQALDIVRVVGNEAVHPGTLDLRDDRGTALHLFDLVNGIADQMISHPKKVTELYAKLPEAKRKAIAQRDKT